MGFKMVSAGKIFKIREATDLNTVAAKLRDYSREEIYKSIKEFLGKGK